MSVDDECVTMLIVAGLYIELHRFDEAETLLKAIEQHADVW
jgi:hypothetical protein